IRSQAKANSFATATKKYQHNMSNDKSYANIGIIQLQDATTYPNFKATATTYLQTEMIERFVTDANALNPNDPDSIQLDSKARRALIANMADNVKKVITLNTEAMQSAFNLWKCIGELYGSSDTALMEMAHTLDTITHSAAEEPMAFVATCKHLHQQLASTDY
ncbi:hypothetical protein HDU97_009766, partial [Phlyctochytrium planicorne]